MAINKNHEFEDLDNIKCAIVEKNISAERVAFLKELLSFNKYQVVVVPSPAPKTIAVPTETTEQTNNTDFLPPSTFTVGVTDLRFNPTNALFGRSLITPTGHIVTLAYWNQQTDISDDTTPYFQQHQ